jgi:hypothetical protein
MTIPFNWRKWLFCGEVNSMLSHHLILEGSAAWSRPLRRWNKLGAARDKSLQSNQSTRGYQDGFFKQAAVVACSTLVFALFCVMLFALPSSALHFTLVLRATGLEVETVDFPRLTPGFSGLISPVWRKQ